MTEQKKVNYINVGCGKKYHTSWENVDMVSHSKHVKKANLLKGIPYKSNTFEVVYHSQVLEHFPKDKAENFIKECYRILKPGGIIRIVVPDLQNIVLEYQKHLELLINNPDKDLKGNYDWIMLEMFDQTVRNSSGGLMKEYLEKDLHSKNEFIKQRMGFVGNKIQEKKVEKPSDKFKRVIDEMGFVKLIALIVSNIKNKILGTLLGQKYRIGQFRLGGEIHYWMYDQYSLGRLLKDCGFKNIQVQNAHKSNIPDWHMYELDVKNEILYDPTSLFMEAVK